MEFPDVSERTCLHIKGKPKSIDYLLKKVDRFCKSRRIVMPILYEDYLDSDELIIGYETRGVNTEDMNKIFDMIDQFNKNRKNRIQWEMLPSWNMKRR